MIMIFTIVTVVFVRLSNRWLGDEIKLKDVPNTHADAIVMGCRSFRFENRKLPLR